MELLLRCVNNHTRLPLPNAADWGSVCYVCMLHRGCNCLLAREMNVPIMHCGTVSSCQSTVNSETD